jgi:hypothetical protein
MIIGVPIGPSGDSVEFADIVSDLVKNCSAAIEHLKIHVHYPPSTIHVIGMIEYAFLPASALDLGLLTSILSRIISPGTGG